MTIPPSPLAGLTIIVTRPEAQASAFANRLAELGARPLVIPAIQIADVADTAELQLAQERLPDYDFAMFVSVSAVIHGLAGVVWPSRLLALAPGKGTARALAHHGVERDSILFPTTTFDSEGLLALPQLQDVTGKRFIIFRGEEGRTLFADTLIERGATVDVVACYRRLCPPLLPEKLRESLLRDKLDAITFTASEAISNWETMVDAATAAALKKLPAFVVHPRIAACAESFGWQTVQTDGGDEGLIAGLLEYFEKDIKKNPQDMNKNNVASDAAAASPGEDQQQRNVLATEPPDTVTDTTSARSRQRSLQSKKDIRMASQEEKAAAAEVPPGSETGAAIPEATASGSVLEVVEAPQNEPEAAAPEANSAGAEVPPANSERMARPRQRQKKNASRNSVIFLWFVLIVFFALLAGGGWFGWKYGQTIVGAQLARIDQLEVASKKLQDELASYQYKPLIEQMGVLTKDIQQLKNDSEIEKRYYSQRPLVGDDVLMYEIEYRVRFAEQQLMVGNADIALTMLSKAEEDLAALKRLDLANVRIQLNQNLEALRKTPAFDGREYIVRIDRALNAIQDMPPYDIPTAMPEQPITPEPPAEQQAELSTWQLWLKDIKRLVRAMVRIHIGKPDQEHVVMVDLGMDRQELRLRLLSLRLMVMIRNSEARTEAISLNAWLSHRFDESNEEVKALHELLNELTASAIVAPLPDVKNTLTAIRAWRAAQR